MTEEEFRQDLRAEGYGNPKSIAVAPDWQKDMHTHEESVRVWIESGEFTLILESGATSYGPGEWCEIPAGTLHTEKMSPGGVSALLAVK